MSATGCVAIIPVKPLPAALGRLAEVLDGPRRGALQAAMLADVLEACTRAARIDNIIVVTNDPGAAMVAGRVGARVIDDHQPPRGINPAVERGLTKAREYDTALVLTADLPQVTPVALDGLIVAARSRALALVPSADGTGTNAMLMRPPGVIAARLGPDSLARHVAQARTRGIDWEVIPVAALAVDVDRPDDLMRVVESGACGVEFTRAWRVVGGVGV